MKRYKIRKVFKDLNKRPRIVETGLTEKEAQAIVAKDQEQNPKALSYMLTYTEQ